MKQFYLTFPNGSALSTRPEGEMGSTALSPSAVSGMGSTVLSPSSDGEEKGSTALSPSLKDVGGVRIDVCGTATYLVYSTYETGERDSLLLFGAVGHYQLGHSAAQL